MCVCVCDLDISPNRRPGPKMGCSTTENEWKICIALSYKLIIYRNEIGVVVRYTSLSVTEMCLHHSRTFDMYMFQATGEKFISPRVE